MNFASCYLPIPTASTESSAVSSRLGDSSVSFWEACADRMSAKAIAETFAAGFDDRLRNNC